MNLIRPLGRDGRYQILELVLALLRLAGISRSFRKGRQSDIALTIEIWLIRFCGWPRVVLASFWRRFGVVPLNQ